jgi:hypothetical protein
LTIRTGFLRDAFGLRDELLALGFAFSLGCGGSGVFSGAESFNSSLW